MNWNVVHVYQPSSSSQYLSDLNSTVLRTQKISLKNNGYIFTSNLLLEYANYFIPLSQTHVGDNCTLHLH